MAQPSVIYLQRRDHLTLVDLLSNLACAEVGREDQWLRRIARLVSVVDRIAKTTGDAEQLTAEVVRVLVRDVRDEEASLFSLRAQTTSKGRLVTLGLAWGAVRRIAPTRPHPVVSRRPPGNVLVALPLPVLDRTGDRLSRRGRKSVFLTNAFEWVEQVATVDRDSGRRVQADG